MTTDITVITPQFEREDGKDSEPAPASREDFEALREADVDDLEELGLRKWSSTEDGELWLFPGEWFDHIPAGLEVTSINEETREFDPENESRDIRFGCLAVGVEIVT